MKRSRLICVAAALIMAAAMDEAMPEETVTEEAKVAPYDLPPALQMADGRPVASAEMWRSERRPELLRLFDSNVYGKMPPRPERLTFGAEAVDEKALGGAAIRKSIAAKFPAAGEATAFHVTLYLPASAAKAPVPVFVGMHLFDIKADRPQPGKLLTEDLRRRAEGGALSAEDAAAIAGLPGEKLAEAILARGYGFATLNAEEIAPDDAKRHREGCVGRWLGGAGDPGPDEWGAITAWAWGLSRALDYFETDAMIDAKRTIVIGHSRMGKTALRASAGDERFAIAISNNSGCGGAALSKRVFGETVGMINTRFPHWFCGNFKKFNENEAALPIDQHELIALTAPRPAYVASAEKDAWADPKGEFLAASAAGAVYELLGKTGLGTDAMPAMNAQIGGTIGYHIRSGGHALSDYDWMRYLDFADRVFGESKSPQ